jgi:hypothetical protein
MAVGSAARLLSWSPAPGLKLVAKRLRALTSFWVALLVYPAMSPALAEETFKEFEVTFWVRDKANPLPIRSPKLQFLFPADFEVVNFRTANGGPFYGTRKEIDQVQREDYRLERGVFQFRDVIRGPSPEGPLFDRSTNRFLFETKSRQSWQLANITIDDMRRVDTRSFPILLIKASYRNGGIGYWAHVVLPDDAFITIVYWTAQVPTKLNQQIWDRFSSNIREP